MATNNIAVEQAGTLYGLFQERVHRTPHNPAYRSYDSNSESWHDITWQDVANQVALWQQALLQEDLEPGDTIALNLKNCKEWVFFDQAAHGLGLIIVPLYPDDRPDNVAYILQDADVKLLFMQNSGQWKRLQPSITEEHALKRVVIFGEGEADSLSEPAMYTQQWLPEIWGALQEWDTDPHKLASIIYTSGTTGRPKGVMLSHHNMLSVASSTAQLAKLSAEDLFLSFLPLSHTLERTAGYYMPMIAGACVAYARGIAQLSTDLQTVKPTIMIAVPRIFERIYVRLQDQMTAGSKFKKTLFHAAVKTGWTKFQYDQGKIGWRPSLLLNPLLEKLVSSKVQARLGGNIRIIVSGGAALPTPVAKMFIGLGFCLVQGYGLTETSPMISVNTPEDNDPTSVGPAIPGVAVMIGENDELLARGPGNMLGYWNNHKATAQVIDSRGWLHTGDQAKIEDGKIHITGRIKEILVLSNGEKVPPGDIENAILLDSLFEQALVIGEGENFLAALLVLNQEKWVSYAKEHSCDPFDTDSLNNKDVHASITKLLRDLLHDFPAYARIRKVALTLDPWEVDAGLMTPTMKIKRPQVMAHHKTDIEHIYS
jgi:long-chain acyl-CoA synthetase